MPPPKKGQGGGGGGGGVARGGVVNFSSRQTERAPKARKTTFFAHFLEVARLQSEFCTKDFF